MNILYLSPNFPPNYFQFPVHLRDFGATVVGVGWGAYEDMRRETAQALTGYCQVSDMGHYDHVLKATAHLISRVGKLDRIVSQEEHWIDLEAQLRLDFNVPGKKPDEIRPIRHKSIMKATFRRAGVPVADGELASDAEAGRAFAARVGYPVIAKPDKGVGAHATYKLSSDGHMEDFFRHKTPGVPYILEEYLDGYIQSFDGLTDRDGDIVFFTSHRFSIDIMSAVNDDDHIHYWSLRDVPADLEELGRKSIAAFDIRERFFHLEFIRNPQGKLTAMEINARPPGGLTTDMFNFANDVNLYREWANIVVNGRFDASCSRPWHVSYIGRKAHKRYAHSHEEVLVAQGQAIVAHSPIDSVFRKAIGDYAYLARAKSMAELQPVADFIHRTE